MTLKHQKHIVRMIQTANDWSSDQPDGIALLQLGTTRKIHSEEHRTKALKQIKDEIRWCCRRLEDGIIGSAADDVDALLDLHCLVEISIIGEEWITDAVNMRLNEVLFTAGKL